MKFKSLVYFIGFLFIFLIPLNGWTQNKSNEKTPIISQASWWKATTTAVKEQKSKLETKPPIITNSFAVEKGPYGYIWKIYIEAEDPDGDMERIASIVEEPGFGRYFTDWIVLKPQYRKHFKGYIQWNTRSVAGDLPEWTPITLKISIVDKAGNESNEVIFPFTFESGIKDPYQYKLPTPFDVESLPRIGYIHIDLFPPGGMGWETPDR
jgi:hypothetical protein